MILKVRAKLTHMLLQQLNLRTNKRKTLKKIVKLISPTWEKEQFLHVGGRILRP